MERDDDDAQRKMQQAAEKTADLPLFTKHDKEFGLGARLNYVRQTGDQDADCGEFFYGSFHG